MNKMLQKNLKSLQARYPDLAARMRHHAPSANYRRTTSSSGLVDLARCNGTSEGPIYGVPNPLDTARAYWREKKLRNPALILFLGLDLGYHLVTYLEKPDPNTRAFLLVEKDLDIFWHFLHVVDVAPVLKLPKAYFLVGVPEPQLFEALRRVLNDDLLFTLYKASRVEPTSHSYRQSPAYYKSVLTAFRDAVRDIVYYTGNDPRDTFIGIRNTLLNLDWIAREPGVKGLFGKFKKHPAVVVATGPSLDKNYHLLSEIQDRAIIFSVDASLKFLLKNGVRPHFVTTLERVPEVVPFFQGLAPDACANTVQVTVPVVVPETYAVYPGPKAILYRDLPHFKALGNDKGTLQTGHSSANMAFVLAARMGCDPILLVGQDLAYAEDGSTHASAAYWGTTYDEITAAKTGAFGVRGNVAERVLTNHVWNTFRLCYERDVAAHRGRVINATEGGAYIEGTEVLALRAAIDRHVEGSFPVWEQLRGALRPPGEEEAETFLASVRSAQIPRIVSTLAGARELTDDLIARSGPLLEDPHDDSAIDACLRDVVGIYRRLYRRDLLTEVAGMVIQSSLAQVMIDHYDVPNRLDYADEVNCARLAIHADHLEHIAAMLEKLRSLYQDPARTLP